MNMGGLFQCGVIPLLCVKWKLFAFCMYCTYSFWVSSILMTEWFTGHLAIAVCKMHKFYSKIIKTQILILTYWHQIIWPIGLLRPNHLCVWPIVLSDFIVVFKTWFHNLRLVSSLFNGQNIYDLLLFTETPEEIKKESFTLKEGVMYQTKFYFYVQREIVHGLRYHQKVYKSAIKGKFFYLEFWMIFF